MPKKMKIHTGFTLAELLVVIGLTSMAVVFVTGILFANYRLYDMESGKVEAVNAARASADRINESARGAIQIISTRTVDAVQYTTGAATVIFELPAIDAGGGIVADKFDYIIVSEDPNDAVRLLLISDPDPASARGERALELTDGLVDFSLTYDNADLALVKNIYYAITIQEGQRNPVTETVSGSATLRN